MKELKITGKICFENERRPLKFLATVRKVSIQKIFSLMWDRLAFLTFLSSKFFFCLFILTSGLGMTRQW